MPKNAQTTAQLSHYFTPKRWGNNGNSDRLIFLGSKITTDADCSHEIKRCLFLGRKVMTNVGNRDITLPTKVHLLKAMVFLVVMYGWGEGNGNPL